MRGNDDEDFIPSSKRSAHQKDRRNFFRHPRNDRPYGLRVCCASDCLDDARAAQQSAMCQNRLAAIENLQRWADDEKNCVEDF